jgi:hypothetical protein
MTVHAGSRVVGYGPSGRLTDMTAVLRRSASHGIGAPDAIVVILEDVQDYILPRNGCNNPAARRYRPSA